LKIDKIISLLVFLALVLMPVSCKSETDVSRAQSLESIDNYSISIMLSTEYSHDRDGFLYPGEKILLNYRRADNKGTIDKTKTVVWTFTRTSSEEDLSESVSMEGWDAGIVKTFTEEGSYRIRVDLYDFEQYQSVGIEAPLLSTDEREITVEAVDFVIETKEIEPKLMQFNPAVLNPEIGPVYTGLRIQFGDDAIEEFEGSIPESITHTFTVEGFYDVTAELLYEGQYETSVIARGETSFRVKGSLYITTPPGVLKTDTEHTFQAHQFESLTSNPKYKWDFGDGKVSRILATNEATHSYMYSGSYVIRVDLIDGDTKEATVVTSAYLPVEIEESGYFLTELQKMTRFRMNFAVQQDYKDHTSGIFRWDCNTGGKLIWNGTNFSLDWSKGTHSEHVTGRVSEDGAVIEHLIIRHEFLDFNRVTQWYQLVINNLPISTAEAPNRFTVDKQGEELGDFVLSFNTYNTEGYYWTEDAALQIKFEKR